MQRKHFVNSHSTLCSNNDKENVHPVQKQFLLRCFQSALLESLYAEPQIQRATVFLPLSEFWEGGAVLCAAAAAPSPTAASSQAI